MYNPFDGFIMKKFIENNLNNLIKNKSVIAYSFHIQLDVIKNYTQNIQTIDQYSLANCYFWILSTIYSIAVLKEIITVIVSIR